MKVLIVANGKAGRLHPFIEEQVNTIKKKYSKIEFEFFFVNKSGLRGYLKESFRLKKFLRSKGNEINIIHSHYGLSGLVSCLTFSKKRVITLHGSDINNILHRIFSQIAILLSQHSIFVTKSLSNKVFSLNRSVIPCGINLNEKAYSKSFAREKLGWDQSSYKVLFASSFNRPEKNPELAKAVINSQAESFSDLSLVELSGYSREEVNLLMCASDALLLTSRMEGSPQVIKEALYFRLPVVATNVGEVSRILHGSDNTIVCDEDEDQLSKALSEILLKRERIKNNEQVFYYDNNRIADEIYTIYTQLL